MPVWFLVFLLLATFFGIRTMVRGFSRNGLYIAGERISRVTLAYMAVILVTVWVLIAAIQLGFITDYAP